MVVRMAGRRPAQWWAVCASIMAAAIGPAFAQEVIPDFYKEAGRQPNRDYVNQQFGEHIDPFTGALQLHYVDVHVPGNGGFDLKVVRSYSASGVVETNPAAYEGQAGVGWTVHFGRVLHKFSTLPCSGPAFGTSVLNNPVIELPDGSRQVLAYTGNLSPMMLSTQRWRADCASGGMGMVVYSPDGVRYDMTQQVNIGGRFAWYTEKITDRNGNYASISYKAAASPEISSVTTSDGRSIAFTYYDSGQLSRRINTISANGATYSYGYNAISGYTGVYQLTSVTRPGGTRWQYDYFGARGGSLAGSHLMSKMTMPQGGATNYDYDYVYFDSASNPMSRSSVVKSKSTSDGSWDFSYAPGSTSSYDVTTVDTPAGRITYKHIGPNYAASGSVWRVGLLIEKKLGSDQTETYTWDKQKISSQNNVRPGAFVTRVDAGETNAPVMASRSIVRDGATFSTTYSSFDDYGNPGTVAESGGGSYGRSHTSTLTYYINTSLWIVNQLKNQTVSGSGVSITRSFDGNGNLESISRDGVTTSHRYDSEGNVSQTTFPRSLTHSYSSYKRGIPQTESQPEGVTISRSVSNAGNVTSETNGEANTTSYDYDGLNRVTSIGYPSGNSVSISYTSTSKTASRGGLTEATTYDGYGRIKSVTLGGIVRNYGYDALGRRTYESHPGGSGGTSYSYDILDRMKSVSNNDGSTRGISYGGGTVAVRNERSQTTTYGYRSYGNPDEKWLMNVSAPESTSMSIGRNGKDLVTSIAQGGTSRSYGYDSAGYLTSVTNPETGSTSYGRDDAGNMTSRSIGGQSTSYTYDNQNRLKTVNYPSSTPSVTKSYTKTHKLKTITTSNATITYGYDSNDNLTSSRLSVDGRSYTTQLGYNGNDQVASTTYPQTGDIVRYAPDNLGRPTRVAGFVDDVTYWPSGQVKSISYVNGTTSNYDQNNRLWPSTFRTSKGLTRYVNNAYGYDGAGNLTSISDLTDASYNRTLGYDNADRLNTVNGPWGTGSITYSENGNIRTQTYGGATLNYSYDGQNRLSSVSGTRSSSFSYDSYGDITSAYGYTYNYDGVPNLACANCNDAATRADYVYDGLNQRVSVTQGGLKTYEVYSPQGLLLLEHTPSTGKTVEYFYLGGKRIAQRTTDKTSTTKLTAAPNPSALNQPVTLTATVTGSSPTGSVTFKDGSTTIGTESVVSGKATLTYRFTTMGARSLTASYAGDSNNNPSASAPLSFTVNAKATSAVALSASPSAPGIDQPVTLTATVTGFDPSGSIVFKDGSTTLDTVPIAAGKAVYTTSFAAIGSRTLTAVYAGDGQNDASQGTASVNVKLKATSYASLTGGPNPAGISQTVTLQAQVGGFGPTGTVTFYNGSTSLGSFPLVDGKATLSTSFASVGTYNLTVSYSGDARNETSTSPNYVLNVDPQAGSTTTLTLNYLQVVTNQPVVMTATVAGNVPTGNIVFKDGSTTLDTVPLSGGQASLTKTYASVGSHSYTAEYSGDILNRPSVSAAVPLTVITPANTVTTWLLAPPDSMTIGTNAHLRVTVAPAGGGYLQCDRTQGCGVNSYGRVRFLDGATLIEEVDVLPEYVGGDTEYRAVSSWVARSTGSHAIKAEYLGTVPNLPSSTSKTTTVTGPVATTTSWLMAPPDSIQVGDATALQVKVAPTAGGYLLCDSTQGCGASSFGKVRFLDGATLIAEVDVTPEYVGGDTEYRARTNWVATPIGAHTIKAEYSGTTPNQPSSITKVSTVTGAVDTTTTWLEAPATSMTIGTTTHFRVKVAPAAGGDLQCDATQGCGANSYGKVRFLDGATLIEEVFVAPVYVGGATEYQADSRWVARSTGAHNIKADYLGTVPNKPSTISKTTTVTGPVATTTTWLMAPPDSILVGDATALQVKVAPTAGGYLLCDSTQGCSATSFGKVRFLDGATLIAEVDVMPEFVGGDTEYRARTNWVATPAGSHTIKAEYSGTTPNLPSSITKVTTVTSPVDTTTTWIDAPLTSQTIGTNAHLRVKVAPTAGGNLQCDATQGCGANSYGKVRFLDGATLIEEVFVEPVYVGGATEYQAASHWVARSTGAHTIKAEYLGTVPNKPSSITKTTNVTGPVATTTTWVMAPPDSILVGDATAIQVKVAPTAGGNLLCDSTQGCGATSFGKVRFLDGAAVIAEVNVTAEYVGGATEYRARTNWTATPAGAHTIKAEYLGTLPNQPSSITKVTTVTSPVATTTTWLVSPPTSMTIGTNTQLRVKVAPTAGGNLQCDATQGCGANSYGKVRFLDGTTLIEEVFVEPEYVGGATEYWAESRWVPRSTGSHTIKAEYLGTVPNRPSSSTKTTNVTAAVATTTTWTSAPPDSMGKGRNAMLEVKVAPTAGGNLLCDATLGCSTTSYGKVKFTDGSTVIADISVEPIYVGGATEYRARTNWTPTTTGSRAVKAQYSGTVPNAASSITKTVNVTNPIATTTTWIDPPPSSITVGTNAHITVQVAPTAGGALPCDASLGCSTTSYGRVRFLDGTTVIEEVFVEFDWRENRYTARPGGGWAPRTTGSRTIKAEYLGTMPNSPSSVSKTSNVTGPIATVTTWSSAPPSSTRVGTTVSFVAKVTNTGSAQLLCDSTQGCGTNSYGKVRFLDGATTISEVDVVPEYIGGGTTEYRARGSWRAPSSGTHTIKAQYLGTTPNQGSYVTKSVSVSAALSALPPDRSIRLALLDPPLPWLSDQMPAAGLPRRPAPARDLRIQ